MEEPVGRELSDLASRASKKETWPRLRRYAESAKNPEWRGLAYFVLGYQEYQAHEYPAAAADLRQAAQSKFSLADFAEYYWGEAAGAANQPGGAVEALEGFSERHPNSSLRLDALALLAQVLLESGRAERAVRALTAEPRVRERPSLALLLARAYQQTQRFEESTRAYRDVYYGFPTAPEAKTAAEALRKLEALLGANYPRPTEEVQTTRGGILLANARFDEGLREFGALLRTRPMSPLVGRWKVDLARCLLGLKRERDAIELLDTTASQDPEIDRERLVALVEARTRLQDTTGIDLALDQLRARYSEWPSYASALFQAGSFYGRQGDWEAAARYYQPLAQSFPMTDLGREANWRVAWVYYLRKDKPSAERALVDHLTRYPASPHTPAALYWLGRLKEEAGALPEARELYEFIKKRYGQTYYSREANRRLKDFSHGLKAVANLGIWNPVSTVGDLTGIVPQRGSPRIPLCAAVSSSEALRASLTLKALKLESLAEEYLKTLISEGTTEPEVFFTLSQLYAERRDYTAALLQIAKALPNFSEYEFNELPREVWELLYPRLYWKLVAQQAKANGLDPYLIMAIIRQESAFNPRAISRANARGLMQLLPQTASRGRRGRRAAARRLYDPAYNVRLGCKYLRGLLGVYNGNLAQALAAYNAGEIRVETWLEKRSFVEPAEFVESIPFSETRFYVEVVLRDADIYRQLMTASAEFAKCG